jgi:3-deoxy-7-phosphoheptulonate synthase
MIPPAILKEEHPVTESIANTVAIARQEISDIIHQRDNRLVVVVGPCSIHDISSAVEYAERLSSLKRSVHSKLMLVMRTYFEKPRTSVGWKGFINDPDLNESYHINKGLRAARHILMRINEMGLPTACEFLDLQLPQHIADLTSWAAIGARTTERQVHRELASGLSMPVGFKNTTEGNIQRAVEAVIASQQSHWFPSITKQGVSSLFKTTGNNDCHIVLRGGSQTGPNFERSHVKSAIQLLESNLLPPRLMIDCSHGNSNKNHKNQHRVVQEIQNQLKEPNHGILGIMLESHLLEGRQEISDNLTYGQSITDACLSWEDTERLLLELSESL